MASPLRTGCRRPSAHPHHRHRYATRPAPASGGRDAQRNAEGRHPTGRHPPPGGPRLDDHDGPHLPRNAPGSHCMWWCRIRPANRCPTRPSARISCRVAPAARAGMGDSPEIRLAATTCGGAGCAQPLEARLPRPPAFHVAWRRRPAPAWGTRLTRAGRDPATPFLGMRSPPGPSPAAGTGCGPPGSAACPVQSALARATEEGSQRHVARIGQLAQVVSQSRRPSTSVRVDTILATGVGR
jgi:hypothetical protein